MLRIMIMLGMHGKSHQAKERVLSAWMDANGVGC